MRLQAAIPLLTLCLAPILAIEPSLFSLNALSCSSTSAGDRLLRSCSDKVGNGYCVDRIGQSYPYCSANTNLTKIECQKAASEQSEVVGYEYDSATQDCFVLLENESVAWNMCQTGFTAVLDDVGTGPIVASDDYFTNHVECYACVTEG
ncbi:hypothetical protein FisN_26Lh013 [Fistulifera solaris]|uniref:Uncharacterized protein n=1 Tax=Fistulifera solaris TaxID=1519565 RepID=A0A1Z5KCN0_FISSO|nr:hypothetical protein FisN_26Lh013 [Fistulifera solaris]|eukprot:GAX23956.1 hypothetical protein FisN_26Lh013 [Fistulifera solaris]